jgi:hypothetical protein
LRSKTATVCLPARSAAPGGPGARAHRDDRDLGVVHSVGLDEAVLAAGQRAVIAPHLEDDVLRRGHRVRLADLVLEEVGRPGQDTRRDRVLGVEQVVRGAVLADVLLDDLVR